MSTKQLSVGYQLACFLVSQYADTNCLMYVRCGGEFSMSADTQPPTML